MGRPWFDAGSGDLVIDRYVMDTPSYQRIMADEQVSDDELTQHAQKVTDLLGQLESRLPEDARDAFTDAMSELAVLNALYQKRLEQDG